MPIPLLAMGAASLGSKLLGGWLKGKGEKKKSEAEQKAREEEYAARKANWEAQQARRGGRLDAIQGAIGNVGGALPEGAPNYSFDPEVLARMKEALPFGESVGGQAGRVGGDPQAGAGYNMLSGFADTVGQGADSMILGSAGGGGAAFDPSQGGGGALSAGSFSPGAPISQGTYWDDLLRDRRG